MWLTEHDLEKLPRQKCSRGKAELIPLDSDMARQLAEKAKSNGGSIRIGNYAYKYRESGGRKYILRIKMEGRKVG